MLRSDFASSYVKTVDQLIDQNSGDWNVNMLTAIFDAETVGEIRKIRIPIRMRLDGSPTHNGEFTVKTAYRVVADRMQGHVQDSFNWKAFWKVKLPPKVKHFLWKCINDCLTLRSKISRYVPNFNPNCPLCNNHKMSGHQNFMECFEQ